MSDSSPQPRRGKTKGLVVVLVLCVVGGASVFGYDVATSKSASPTTSDPGLVYNYSCCSTPFHQKFHAGVEVVFHWRRTAFREPGTPASPITLTTQLSHQFASVKAVTSRAHADSRGFTLGPYILSADPVTLSDEVRANPVTRIRIPRTAKPGWYEIKCTSTVNGVASETGLVFRVFPAPPVPSR